MYFCVSLTTDSILYQKPLMKFKLYLGYRLMQWKTFIKLFNILEKIQRILLQQNFLVYLQNSSLNLRQVSNMKLCIHSNMTRNVIIILFVLEKMFLYCLIYIRKDFWDLVSMTMTKAGEKWFWLQTGTIL